MKFARKLREIIVKSRKKKEEEKMDDRRGMIRVTKKLLRKKER